MGAAVSLRNVGKSFPGSDPQSGEPVIALSDVDLEIAAGKVVGIVGYSGAGKSTLVRLINALDRPTSGRVLVNGLDITDLPERRLREVRGGIGMVFQQFNLLKSRTVAGNVAYPLKVAKWPKAEIGPRVAELLEFVGIGDKARRYPRRLSGGQQQRVGLARALATGPGILLADEATSALDPETTIEVLGLLRRINREFGTTIVVITHEMSVVREICDEVVMMEGGRVIEQGPVYEVFSNPQEPATRRFVGSAIQGLPEAATIARLEQAHPGTLLAVSINALATTAVVAQAFTEERVTGLVIHGGITEVDQKPLGTLTYALEGSSSDIAAVVARLGRLTTITDLTASRAQHDAELAHVEVAA